MDDGVIGFGLTRKGLRARPHHLLPSPFRELVHRDSQLFQPRADLAQNGVAYPGIIYDELQPVANIIVHDLRPRLHYARYPPLPRAHAVRATKEEQRRRRLVTSEKHQNQIQLASACCYKT